MEPTAPGLAERRSENQDALGEFSTPSGERLLIVADGMGGNRDSAAASRLCVEMIGRAFSDGSETTEERLRIGIELANARSDAAAESDSALARSSGSW
jgi:serine/threonine protein phosphatase PrpC